MDVKQLRYFLAVVDHGGFGRAAATLHVAQPSLSQAIARFEAELGAPLFHRVGRGVVLSSAGTALVGPARTVVRDLEHAEAAIGLGTSPDAGHLDVIAMPSPGVEPLSTLLATFLESRAGATVDVSGAFTADRAIEAVRSGEHEIGVVGTSGTKRIRGLRRVTLEKQPFVLVSSPGSVHGDGPTITHDRMSGLELIVSQRGSLMRAIVDGILDSGIDVSIKVQVAHRTSIVPLVMKGVGQAIMAAAWGDQARLAGAVVQRIVPETYLHIAAVSRPEHLTPAAEAFMHVAEEYGRARPGAERD